MIDPDRSNPVAAAIVAAIAGLQGVAAMSLGGSTASGLADDASDLDVHVLWQFPLADLGERAARLAQCAEPDSVRVDIRSWGLEDHFRMSGRKVELIYLYLDDMRAEVDRAYDPGLSSEDATTALLYILANGQPLHDPSGACDALHSRLNAAFPEATYQAVLEQRSPLLRIYLSDLRVAQRRGDLLMAQGLACGLRGLFFNLLFTLNRMYHPGGKRLLRHSERCAFRPVDCAERWLRVVNLPAGDPALVVRLGSLVDDLQRLIEEHSGIKLSAEPW